MLAALLNYVPYVGPAVMVIVLFGVGLVTFPSLGHAFIAPLGLIVLTTAEGHFVTPTIVGRRLTLNPLLVFLALAFWTWMWGPIGRIARRAAVDRRPRHRQPSVSGRRRQFARGTPRSLTLPLRTTYESALHRQCAH